MQYQGRGAASARGLVLDLSWPGEEDSTMDTNLSCSAPENEVGLLAFPASAADAMGSAIEALNSCILRIAEGGVVHVGRKGGCTCS